MRFAKGHGTGNDFVVLPDPEGTLALSPTLVARLCDRRTGIGGDGVLRIVPASPGGDARWFMDYWNADGSVAEMCGNGIRVMARYLVDHGLVKGPVFTVATRAGARVIREEPDGRLTVDMGPWTLHGSGRAVVGGVLCEGLRISVGNPHLACVVDIPVEKFDLAEPPAVDSALFPHGVNVELVRVVGERRVEMRVHERGSGETCSCGTGAVAAAVAAATHVGERAGTWRVRVPGGELTVELTEVRSVLTGPAVIVAEGEVSSTWVAAARGCGSPVTRGV